MSRRVAAVGDLVPPRDAIVDDNGHARRDICVCTVDELFDVDLGYRREDLRRIGGTSRRRRDLRRGSRGRCLDRDRAHRRCRGFRRLDVRAWIVGSGRRRGSPSQRVSSKVRKRLAARIASRTREVRAAIHIRSQPPLVARLRVAPTSTTRTCSPRATNRFTASDGSSLTPSVARTRFDRQLSRAR